jgi:hypothetical protein
MLSDVQNAVAECVGPMVAHLLNADVVHASVFTAFSLWDLATVDPLQRRYRLLPLEHKASRAGLHAGNGHVTRQMLVEKILRYATCVHEFHYAQPRKDSHETSAQQCVLCSKNTTVVGIPEPKPPVTEDKTMARGTTHKEVEDSEAAWECRCGMTMCGNCKDSYMKVFADTPRAKSTLDPANSDERKASED